MKINHSPLILISGLIWLIAGISLLQLGLKLLVITPEGAYAEGVTLLIAVALLIGILKGKYVLKKSAMRIVDRILSLPNPVSIAKAYSKKYLLLLAVMVGLGMLVKHSGMREDIRGFIDVAIGAALIQGSTHYFRQLLVIFRSF